MDLYAYITPIETFEYLTKYFNKGKQKDLLYLSGWFAGYKIVRNLIKSYKIKDPPSKYYIAMNFLEVGGYGKYKTIEFSPGIRSRFLYLTNPLPVKVYPSKEPICTYIRRLNAGGGTWVHGKLVNCIELKCAAVNGKYCEFINFCFDDRKTLSNYKEIVDIQKNMLRKIRRIVKEFLYLRRNSSK